MDFPSLVGNTYLPTVLSVNGGQTINLFIHAMHGIPNPSAELWMLDFVCNPALPRQLGWVEAIAETHHNQSPMRWVSLRALQVALLCPSELQIDTQQTTRLENPEHKVSIVCTALVDCRRKSILRP